MHLVFGGNPGAAQRGYYYALRMGGNNTDLFNNYINNGSITYDIGGLSARYQATFGVHTDGSYTYLGVPIPLKGTLISIR